MSCHAVYLTVSFIRQFILTALVGVANLNFSMGFVLFCMNCLFFFFFCTKMINQETTYFRVLQGMSDNLAEFKRSLIHP